MNLESFKAGTVTFLVSKARKAPNTSSKPEINIQYVNKGHDTNVEILFIK